jgi:hypothetical protein
MASYQPKIYKSNSTAGRMTLNLSSLLYLLFFCSVLFSQITIYDSTRISIPIKEASVFVFLSALPFLLCYKMMSEVGKHLSLFFFYSSALTIIYLTWNYRAIIDEIPYPVVAGYMYLYVIGIIFSQVPFQPERASKYFRTGFNILCINSYIALFLYIAFFIGINPIMLGVNHASFYRAFGFMPEPSHFSIVSGLTLLIYIYFVWQVKYYKLNKIKLTILTLSFILSQSPTGFVFIGLCIIFYFLKRRVWLLLPLLFIAFIIAILGGDFEGNTIGRGIERIAYDVDVISSFFANNYNLIDDINEYSRAGRLIGLIPWLKDISLLDYVFGLGLGGQNLILPSTNNFFPGPIYLVVELGFLGLSMIALIYVAAFGRGRGVLNWVLVPYVFVCFVNSPGGIFGAQFLVLVFFLGNAGVVSLESQKPYALGHGNFAKNQI